MTIRTLKHDIAQMVMPRIDGQRLSDERYRAGLAELAAAGIGGFILFGGDVEQTPRFLADLQGRAEVPLLIASDVERGLGQQLAGGTRFPSQRAVAAAISRRSRKDLDLLNGMLDAVRTETRAAGIHAVFSPVVDVNNNPDNPIICTRAFGDEPRVVEWFGARYIRRLQHADRRGRLALLACAKHFPGHGDTDQDSHTVLPVIRADKPRLNRVELPPFREAVKDGVAMVMVAHLLVPALDPQKPTTFSKKIITALLREGMEFDGLIVSDALDMGALAGQYAQDEIAVRAVEAGIDILLHPVDARVTIDAVAAAVEQGRLTEQHIRESADRIMTAKKTLGLLDAQGQGSVTIDYEKHRRIARKIGSKAVQVVAGDKRALPFRTRDGVACFVLDDDSGEDIGAVFLSEMRRRSGNFSGMVLTPKSTPGSPQVLDAIGKAGAIVLAIYSKISASKGRSGIAEGLRAGATAILRAAKAAGKRSAVISFDSPYLLPQFKDADVLIAAYDRMDAIQQAAAELVGNE